MTALWYWIQMVVLLLYETHISKHSLKSIQFCRKFICNFVSIPVCLCCVCSVYIKCERWAYMCFGCFVYSHFAYTTHYPISIVAVRHSKYPNRIFKYENGRGKQCASITYRKKSCNNNNGREKRLAVVKFGVGERNKRKHKI